MKKGRRECKEGEKDVTIKCMLLLELKLGVRIMSSVLHTGYRLTALRLRKFRIMNRNHRTRAFITQNNIV